MQTELNTTGAAAPENAPVRIVILQRGHVMIGRLSKSADQCTLTNAKVIRRWGTTEGLGQLAKHGPQPNTRLDECGEVTFHVLTTICSIAVDESKWPGI